MSYLANAASYNNEISRMSTSGVVTNFSLPQESTGSTTPINPKGVIDTDTGIASGPDGALWFTDPENNSIDRMTTSGTLTQCPIPTTQSDPQGIAVGPDGALWFAEQGANRIGRITTSGTITEFSRPCPATAKAHRRMEPAARIRR